jgi:hypothetical protein
MAQKIICADEIISKKERAIVLIARLGYGYSHRRKKLSLRTMPFIRIILFPRSLKGE